MGGDLIHLPGDVTTHTAYLITDNLIFNSVLSTKNGKLICADISIFYLSNPMDIYEYMKLPLDIIPEEIIQQYNIRNLSYKGFGYMEIKEGIYGLPQAVNNSNDKPKLYLAKFGYKPAPIIPGICWYQTRPFNLHW